MKIKFFYAIFLTLTLNACFPVEPVKPVVIDRFDIGQYAANTANGADITGLWIMISKNYQMAQGNESISAKIRQSCAITSEGANRYRLCDSIDMTLNGSDLVSDNGKYQFTVANNNVEMSGTLSGDTEYVLLYGPLLSEDGAVLEQANFKLVKVAGIGQSFGSFHTDFSGLDEVSDIDSFIQFEALRYDISSGEKVLRYKDSYMVFRDAVTTSWLTWQKWTQGEDSEKLSIGMQTYNITIDDFYSDVPARRFATVDIDHLFEGNDLITGSSYQSHLDFYLP